MYVQGDSDCHNEGEEVVVSSDSDEDCQVFPDPQIGVVSGAALFVMLTLLPNAYKYFFIRESVDL